MTKRRLFIRRPGINEPPARKGARINELIEVATIRLVNEEGEMVGIVSKEEGLEMAYEVDLDLVEVSPNADPPVCKILDYGKFRYAEQRKANEARKKQKTIHVKEIKMRPSIDVHDYEVKMRSARRFLGDGNKVKVTIRFRGRELSHQELGIKVLDRVRDDLEELAKVEQFPHVEGRMMTMIISPR